MAGSHWIEQQTGWSIKKFVRTARRYHTVTIKAGRHILTAAEPLPDDLAEALAKIRGSGAHYFDKSQVRGARVANHQRVLLGLAQRHGHGHH
jgi:hypothetical protein